MNLRNRKRLWIVLGLAAITLVAWLIVNPPGRFGICCFGYTTYSAIPIPGLDVQARANGLFRPVGKTHGITQDVIAPLLDPIPEVLIIATGWDGVSRVAPDLKLPRGCELKALPNKEAIHLFNQLKSQGRRVAIRYHSTC